MTKISKTVKATGCEFLCLDTTGVELMSALAGIAMGIGMFFGYLHPIFWHKTPEFWAMIITITASLQLSSIIVQDQKSFNVLRVILALIAAAGWLWLGLRQIDRNQEPSDIAIVFLGISNLQAFVSLSLIRNCKHKRL